MWYKQTKGQGGAKALGKKEKRDPLKDAAEEFKKKKHRGDASRDNKKAKEGPRHFRLQANRRLRAGWGAKVRGKKILKKHGPC